MLLTFFDRRRHCSLDRLIVFNKGLTYHGDDYHLCVCDSLCDSVGMFAYLAISVIPFLLLPFNLYDRATLT